MRLPPLLSLASWCWRHHCGAAQRARSRPLSAPPIVNNRRSVATVVGEVMTLTGKNLGGPARSIRIRLRRRVDDLDASSPLVLEWSLRRDPPDAAAGYSGQLTVTVDGAVDAAVACSIFMYPSSHVSRAAGNGEASFR